MRIWRIGGAIAAGLAAFAATLLVVNYAPFWPGDSGGREASAFTLISVGVPAGGEASEPASEIAPDDSNEPATQPQSPGAPLLLSLQGKLTDNAGQPVSNGSYSVTFSLHDELTGGTQIWTETQNVTTSGGLFTTSLGAITALQVSHLAQSPDTWLQVRVSPDPPMTPRLRLLSAPYSVIAAEAEGLTCPACVGSSDIATGAVDSARILDGSVGTVDLANGAVTTAKLAAGSVTSAQIADGSVFGVDIANDAVTADKVSFPYAAGSGEGGAALSLERQGYTLTTLDSAGNVGAFTSVAIGEDGLPVIAYADGTDGFLNVVHCGNPACNSGNIVTPVDLAANVGGTSITIGADGFPIVAYWELNTLDLRVVHCGSRTCASGNANAAIDVAGNVGAYPSITLGADGLPVISYHDAGAFDLKVLHCGNVTCVLGNTVTLVDSAGTVGSYSSITIGADGLPVISYTDETNWDLKVAHCGNTLCNAGNILAIVDSTVLVGDHTSIAIGADGLPVVAYRGISVTGLKAAKCGSPDCTTGNVVTALVTAGNVGTYTGVTVGDDGIPMISYRDEDNQDLAVFRCRDAACTAGSSAVVAAAGNEGRYASIATGSDGMAIITYQDAQNFDLRAAHCSNRFCVPYHRSR